MKTASPPKETRKKSGSSGRVGFELSETAVYNRTEVAEILGCTVKHVGYLMRHKNLPIKSGGRGIILGRDLMEWISAQSRRDTPETASA